MELIGERGHEAREEEWSGVEGRGGDVRGRTRHDPTWSGGEHRSGSSLVLAYTGTRLLRSVLLLQMS